LVCRTLYLQQCPIVYSVRSLPGFEPVAAEKPHARIIWDCTFGPDSSYFVTAARDKQFKLWKRAASEGDKWELAATVKGAEAATAVAIIRDEENQR
jgi:elongator complex protein 2